MSDKSMRALPVTTLQLLFVFVLHVLFVNIAFAQSTDDYTCAEAPSAATLKACTSVIAKGGDPIAVARAHFNRGISREAKKQFREAVKDYTEAIRLNPSYSLPYNNRALIYSMQGKKKQALSDFNRSIEIDSTNFYALNSRGRFFLVDRNDPERAIEDFDKAIALNPQFGVAYANRGFAYEKLGDKPKALADLERALELGPNKQQQQMINRSLRKLKKR